MIKSQTQREVTSWNKKSGKSKSHLKLGFVGDSFNPNEKEFLLEKEKRAHQVSRHNNGRFGDVLIVKTER